MVEVVMEVAPFFVFALMAGVIAKMADNPAEVIEIFKGVAQLFGGRPPGLGIMIFAFTPP